MPDNNVKVEKYQDVESSFRKNMPLILLGYAFLFLAIVLYFVFRENPEIYKIDQEIIQVLNYALNAFILLIIPFTFGILGGLTKLLISNYEVKKNVSLLGASGLMAAVSWVGLKSGVALSIVAPHFKEKIISPESTEMTQHEFYTLVLVALVIGMFATNFYLFMEQRVEQLTKKK